MNYYRCENPDCGFLAEEEPDVCPQCGGTFFLSVDEEELTGPDWVQLGNRAVDEERPTDALACYQQAAALDDMLGVTNLGWCLEAGIGVPADPRQAVVLYAQAAARDYMPALTNLGYCYAHGIGVARDDSKAVECFRRGRKTAFPGPSSCWGRHIPAAWEWSRATRRPPAGISPPRGWVIPRRRPNWGVAWSSAPACPRVSSRR